LLGFGLVSSVGIGASRSGMSAIPDKGEAR
jgi:hypothetical protein